MTSFKQIMQDFADNLNWEVEWANDGGKVDFELESGDTQAVFFTDNGDTVEFEVFSNYYYENENDIDHAVSTQLLMRNAELPVGAWVLEQSEGDWHFCVMYNEDLDTLEAMDYDELMTNLNVIINEARSLS